ncbi:MAG: CcmD family protein [Parafilimonas sp.]|nr:CcmD family protein [Parafilimonas sp.]
MKQFKKYSLLSLLLFTITSSFAQDVLNGSDKSFMTDNGKINVVMAVVVVIVLGLFIYLLNLDRKISRLEKKKE